MIVYSPGYSLSYLNDHLLTGITFFASKPDSIVGVGSEDLSFLYVLSEIKLNICC